MNEARTTRVSRRTTEEAAAWHLDMREEVDAGTRQRFLDWLRRSPQHVAEYLAIAQLHGEMRAATLAEIATFDELRALADSEPSVLPFVRGGQASRVAAPQDGQRPSAAAEPATAHRHERQRARTVRHLAIAASVAIAVSIGLIGAWPARETPAVRYAADAAAVRSVALDDGTWLQLAPGAMVDVAFDLHARRITLIAGYASFDIGKDPARPLSVMAGGQRIDDIGTVFNVGLRDGETDVSVVSGRVTVSQRPVAWLDRASQRVTGSAWSTDLIVALGAGEDARVAMDGRLLGHANHATATVAPWLPAEIAFHGSSVADVARRFNAYTQAPLTIDDPDLADKRISGVFHASDVEAFVSYLGSLPNVRVIREPGRIRFVSAKR
jgi:transmembrane sensor